jgi:hypothetical protein
MTANTAVPRIRNRKNLFVSAREARTYATHSGGVAATIGYFHKLNLGFPGSKGGEVDIVVLCLTSEADVWYNEEFLGVKEEKRERQ